MRNHRNNNDDSRDDRNKHRLRRRGRPLVYGTAALLAVAGLTATAVTALATAPNAEAATPDRLGGAATRVTLITGDTVGLDSAGRVVGVDRAAGRKSVPVSVRRFAGHTYVIPLDAGRLLASGRLDRRLFDVTELVADGYDDAHRGTLPLIVSYKGAAADAAKQSVTSAEAEVERQLPAVHGQALTAAKPDVVKVWEALTRPAAHDDGTALATEPGVDRIWLDAKISAPVQRDTAPDPTQGTARIGAPAAWKAGYDGKGVKVAVLDSGVDATHPDLRGVIAGTKDFTGDGGVDDRQGHGTHVAATIAGNGAESDGRYKGVAPGAKLLIGRVFSTGGAQESWLISAMQWATGQGARVVNMSLGQAGSDGVDPVEKAVNDLSASSGALFVIAAGNDGPDTDTLNSPGTAASALTVAAADGADRLADFSSRGPNADGELKPDLSAPGVDIISAKAVHGTDGDPVPTPGYVRMSGTSMATPHVSGSAAILAQEHPAWSGQRIKAALMASAVPMKGTNSPYEQGTGRVDVARAIGQTVVADEPTLGFGLQSWPHTDDKTLTRTLTYRNTGAKEVTLDLSATATGPGTKPAADGMFTLSATRLTVPAGGTSAVTLTADTRVGTVDGAFAGIVTASGPDGQSVRTSFGVVREVESYDLKLKYIGRDGKPAAPYLADVVGLDSGRQRNFLDFGTGSSTVTLRLPRGRYLVDAALTRSTDTRDETTQLVAPGVIMDKNTTLNLDARTGKPVRITAPDARAQFLEGQVVYSARGAKPDYDYYGTLSTSLGGSTRSSVYLAQVGAAVPAKNFIAQAGGVWQRGSTGPLYDLVATRHGSFFTGLTRNFTAHGLAKVVTPIGSNTKGATAVPNSSWAMPGWPGLLTSGDFGAERKVPDGSVTHYVSTEGGLRWRLGASLSDDTHPILANLAPLAPRRFEPGRTYQDTYDTGVFGPIMAAAAQPGDVGATRSGAFYILCVPLLADGTGHVNTTDATTHMRLTSGNTTLTDLSRDPCDFGEPQQGMLGHKATYRLSIDTTRPARDFSVGNHVSAVWTFTQGNVPDTEVAPIPLSVVRFTPKLSLTSTARAGTRFTVPVGIQGPAAKKGAVRSLMVRVSYDGGHTWKNSAVHTGADGKRYLTLDHPARPGTVSFRTTLVDSLGNSLAQTQDNAYRTVK
ncbi:S8 family peptidase [Streptomyces sp. NPDC101455]|uniref:S8 family peptidase n=1 Tax=Streptomyces sp. NPDC101455 TaxID=3366142 RepID=UPI0037F6F8CE